MRSSLKSKRQRETMGKKVSEKEEARKGYATETSYREDRDKEEDPHASRPQDELDQWWGTCWRGGRYEDWVGNEEWRKQEGKQQLQSLASEAVTLKQTSDRDKHGRRERKRTGSSTCRKMIDRDHPPAGQEEEWIKFEGAWWKKIASLPTATNWARGTIL